MRNKRKIYWQCDARTGWRWLSFENKVTYDVRDDNKMRGMAFLPSRPDFWYPCAMLTTGEAIGYAFFRYFIHNGEETVEAVVQAPGHWEFHGEPDTTSRTEGDGGFNLAVSLKKNEVFTENEIEEMEVLIK